jgi:Transposase DDE domain
MDSQGWRMVYQIVREESRKDSGWRRAWYRYRDDLIVFMLLWAALHDRPLSWACRREHYPGWIRPRRLPSISQFSRRLRTERTQAILTAVFRRLAEPDRVTSICFLDGKPLIVGGCSKDRDARPGRVYGGFARGYKIHTITTEDRRILCWSVEPLNVDERRVAVALIHEVRPCGWVLADGHYDSGALYDLVASYGGQLLTPVPAHAGRGHHRQSPARLAAIAAWQGLAGYLYRDRINIEQTFGHLTSCAGGLGPLPAWVRTLPRVRLWVGAKVILYHARLRLRRAVA